DVMKRSAAEAVFFRSRIKRIAAEFIIFRINRPVKFRIHGSETVIDCRIIRKIFFVQSSVNPSGHQHIDGSEYGYAEEHSRKAEESSAHEDRKQHPETR